MKIDKNSKAWKEFEKWYNTGECVTISFYSPFGAMHFTELPFSMQIGVYLEYFDSVGVKTDVRQSGTFFYPNVDGELVFGDGVWFPKNRMDAYDQAITKAFEIREEQLNS